MLLERTYDILDWSEKAAMIAVDYLRSRGFTDAAVTESSNGLVVSGKRGSWLGNLTSFDMTKLKAKIRLSCSDSGRLLVELEVKTFGQIITQWNTAVWRLEFVELHGLLHGLGSIEDVWKRFEKDSQNASLRWLFTFMIGGRRLSRVWEDEILELEAKGIL